MSTYGDIAPRTAGLAARRLLDRAGPLMFIGKFGQTRELPARKSTSIIFRRYNALPPATVPIVEGVTPPGNALTKTDVVCNCSQYGDYMTLTDVIQDHHEDPVLQEMMDICGEQSAETIEMVDFGVLKAGTNVLYANGGARNQVNSGLTLGIHRRATRALDRQKTRKITKYVRSTHAYETANLAPSYVGMCHTDLKPEIEDLPGFIPVERYGQLPAIEGEVGSVGNVRYFCSTIFEPWLDGGGVKGGSGVEMLSQSGTNADVYPILYCGANAYGIVPFKGTKAVKPMVVNPDNPDSSDPLGQRGSVGWKATHGAVILNDMFMVRVEVAVRENPEKA